MITAIFAGLAITSTQAFTADQKVDAVWAAAQDRMLMQEDNWFEDGDFPSIVQLLEFHAEIEPDNYDVATNLGWMHENIEEWDEAVTAYRFYAQANPGDPDRLLPEAEYLFRRKDYAAVLKLVDGKVGDTSHPNLFRITAHSLERTGRLQESKKMWERYLAVAPDDGAAKVNLKRVESKIAAAK